VLFCGTAPRRGKERGKERFKGSRLAKNSGGWFEQKTISILQREFPQEGKESTVGRGRGEATEAGYLTGTGVSFKKSCRRRENIRNQKGFGQGLKKSSKRSHAPPGKEKRGQQ